MSIDLDAAMVKGEAEVDTALLQTNLAKLEQSLLVRDPDMPKLLSLIHKDLAAKPELAHVLTPEQVRSYVDACKQFTSIVIVQDSAKKRKATNVSQVSMDDL